MRAKTTPGPANGDRSRRDATANGWTRSASPTQVSRTPPMIRMRASQTVLFIGHPSVQAVSSPCRGLPMFVSHTRHRAHAPQCHGSIEPCGATSAAAPCWAAPLRAHALSPQGDVAPSATRAPALTTGGGQVSLVIVGALSAPGGELEGALTGTPKKGLLQGIGEFSLASAERWTRGAASGRSSLAVASMEGLGAINREAALAKAAVGLVLRKWPPFRKGPARGRSRLWGPTPERPGSRAIRRSPSGDSGQTRPRRAARPRAPGTSPRSRRHDRGTRSNRSR
jgi:hypothetical protein